MDQSGVLTVDVFKIISDLYYTPIIQWRIVPQEDDDKLDKFYLILQYPFFTLTYRMGLPNCFEDCFEYDHVNDIVDLLQHNKHDTVVYHNFKFVLDNLSIHLCDQHDDYQMMLKNTPITRDQLGAVFVRYKDYLIDMASRAS